MIKLVLFLIGIGLLGIAVFYGIVFLLMLWTGCDFDEAIEKIRGFVNGKEKLSLEQDVNFFNDVWQTVRNVIGDERFNKLVQISNTPIVTPLLSFNYSSGLPYIAVSLYCDDNEKKIIEVLLKNLISKYLNFYSYYPKILVDWKEREDLNMPFIMIRYATNAKQRRIIDWCLAREKQKIITENSDIIDDTEDDELT